MFLFARDTVLWSDPIVRRNSEKIDPSDYVLPACRAKVDGAGDLVDGHASGPEKPGQVPGVDTGEDVPHLVTFDGHALRRELRLIWGALGVLVTLLTVVFGFLFRG